MSASAAKIRVRAATAPLPPEEQRWHPAIRAVTMVALGAVAWVPVIAAGRSILS